MFKANPKLLSHTSEKTLLTHYNQNRSVTFKTVMSNITCNSFINLYKYYFITFCVLLGVERCKKNRILRQTWTLAGCRGVLDFCWFDL